jgi:extracellular factor (EF) 3-hydroxypalmitic acid methyl ester biosynthesis protein
MESRLSTVPPGDQDSLIVCRNSQGAEVRASLLRLSRFEVVFEVYNPYSILQLSEVLSEFRIFIGDRLVYSGRAVVSKMVNTGILVVCEASLADSWLDVDIFSPHRQKARVRHEFGGFLREWEKIGRVLPEFKVAVVDMQMFLMDLRRWLEKVELAIRSEPSGDRHAMEREVIDELRDDVLPVVGEWFRRFDTVANLVEETLLPLHRAYSRRLLHPLVLCSPFVYRTHNKPLGYAGDYEMVNMILREPYEGASLFAKIVNVCFLTNPPAQAHRNRVRYLADLIEREVSARAAVSRRTRVLNLGCGPAQEVQEFLKHSKVSDHADLTLLDFNDETLSHVEEILGRARQRHSRTTTIRFLRKSVHQILKEAARLAEGPDPGLYDLIYCAGLFDYMSERICKRLMNHFYDLLAPGGLLVATNVDASEPFRHSMEFLLEWHLVCRSPKEVEQLRPDAAVEGYWRVATEPTGVNVFIEVRKPEHE